MKILIFRGFSLLVRIFLTLLVMLIALLAFFVTTNMGLKSALLTVPHLFGSRISYSVVEGSVIKGFEIYEIRIKNKQRTISSNRLVWQWQTEKAENYFLDIKKIDLGKVIVVNDDTQKKNNNNNKPVKLPSSLKLPFNINIETIQMESLHWDKLQEPLIKMANFHLQYIDHKYVIKTNSFYLFSANSVGEVSLNDMKPFELVGHLDIYDLDEPQKSYGLIELKGSLQYPEIVFNLFNKNLDLKGEIVLSPFDPIATRRIVAANITGNKINPNLFLSSFITADIAFHLNIQSLENSPTLMGNFLLINNKPNYYQDGGVPLREMNSSFVVKEDGTINIINFIIKTIKEGRLNSVGFLYPDGTIDLEAQIDMGLIDLMAFPIKNTYKGIATLTGTFFNPILNIDLKSPLNQLLVVAELNEKERILQFQKFNVITQQQGKFSFNGTFFLKNHFKVNLDLFFENFNPHNFHPDSPVGHLNGIAKINGDINEMLNIMVAIDNSQLSGFPFLAKGTLTFNLNHIQDSDIHLAVGDNILNLKKKNNDKVDKLFVNINAPRLSDFGFGISGYMKANGYIEGVFRKLIVNLKGEINSLNLPKILSLGYLKFDIDVSPDIYVPLKIDIIGNNLNLNNNKINQITTKLTGTLAQHSGSAQFDLLFNNQKIVGNLAIDGGFDDFYLWTGTVNRLNLSGYIDLILQNTVKLQIAQDRINMGNAKWSFFGGYVDLTSFTWKKNQGVTTKGSANNIQLGKLKDLIKLPFEQNLVLRGDWNVEYNKDAKGQIKITRQAGDVIFSKRKTALGLEELAFQADFINNKIQAKLESKTRFARGGIKLTILQEFGNKILNSPISGEITVVSDNINKFKYLLPIGTDLSGTVDSKIKISGKVAAPQLDGYINGDKITYRDLNNGIILRNGELKSTFSGHKWTIDKFVFKNKEGEINVSGGVGKIADTYGVDINLTLNKYQVMNQPDKQFIISGNTRITLNEQTGLEFTGKLKLDQGKYENSGKEIPKLSDDIYIVGMEKPEPKNLMPFSMDMEIDLNNKLHFIASGLDFIVGGKLNLTARKTEQLKIFGKVNVVKGKYRAYGQNLVVESGSLVFTGAAKNAKLNIRAKRYQSPVGAGIDVTGLLSNPRVTLISDTPMTERQKLSWLVLGRESKGGNDNEVLALATGVLAAEKVNKEVGGVFDNIGLSSVQSRNTSTGELNPAEQIVTVGKQINENIYLGYEFGIRSSSQAARLIYVINKSLDVFGRAGTDSFGGGIKYKIRFD